MSGAGRRTGAGDSWLAAGGLMLSALVWGLSWWPLRHVRALGVQPMWTTALVYLPGAVLVLLLRPQALRQLLRSRGLWLVTLCAGGANVCFNLGVAWGDVVRVVLLFYLMPVWATLAARLVLREPVGRAGLLRLALAMAGALIVLWPSDGGWPLPRHAADWLGLLGGVFFACNNVLLRRFAQAPAASRLLAMFAGGVLCGGLPAWLLQSLRLAPRLPPPSAAWLLPVGLLGLALAAGGFGLQYGAARLPAALTAVIMMLEIVFASLSSALLGASHPGLRTLAGGLLIGFGVLLGALAEARIARIARDARAEHNDGMHQAARAAPRRSP